MKVIVLADSAERNGTERDFFENLAVNCIAPP
jgi:hypothetical protein